MKKLKNAFAAAVNGIRVCGSSEINYRIHVVAAIVAAAAGAWLKINRYEWLALLLCMLLVIITEMINTAIEKLCNMVHKDFHPVIKQVKDIAAGAVLLSALLSMICGIIIFLPKFFTI